MAGHVEVPDAIRRYFDGLNNEDWEDFEGIWTDDAELVGVGARTRKGREDVMTYYSTVLVPYPVHHDDPYAIHVSGDIVTVEIAFAGETHEGVPVAFEAVDVFTLRDGKISRLTTWYDIDRVRKLAARPGAPERRLATLVAHAAANSAFYGRRLAAAGVDSAAELSRLPPTRRSDLAAAGDGLAAAPGRAVARLLACEGFSLPLTAGDVDELDGALAAALELGGVTGEDSILPLGPHRGIAVAAAKLRARLVVPADGDAPAAAALTHPTVVFATRGADVAAFRTRLEELGDPGSIRLVAGTADDGDGWPHARILGFPETGAVAASCGRSEGLHVLDAHIAEVVDDSGATLPAGREGELLVTPLGRRGAPLLRFAAGLRATVLEGGCPCGRPEQRIAVSG